MKWKTFTVNFVVNMPLVHHRQATAADDIRFPDAVLLRIAEGALAYDFDAH